MEPILCRKCLRFLTYINCKIIPKQRLASKCTKYAISRIPYIVGMLELKQMSCRDKSLPPRHFALGPRQNGLRGQFRTFKIWNLHIIEQSEINNIRQQLVKIKACFGDGGGGGGLVTACLPHNKSLWDRIKQGQIMGKVGQINEKEPQNLKRNFNVWLFIV